MAGHNLDLGASERTAVLSGTEKTTTRIWRTIRGYILWSYERGTLQYDVMVTLILLFVFLSPYWINFRDKPVERSPHQTEVAVSPDGNGGFIYQIDGSAISPHDEADMQQQLLRIIEPIAGEVSISKVDKVRDRFGRVQQYKVTVEKQ
jgi:hypothetical protein